MKNEELKSQKLKSQEKMEISDETKDLSHDTVNKPKHYEITVGLDSINLIKALLTKEEYEGFCEGNVIKYIVRWKKKNGLEDLKKARVYFNWLIESVEEDVPRYQEVWKKLEKGLMEYYKTYYEEVEAYDITHEILREMENKGVFEVAR